MSSQTLEKKKVTEDILIEEIYVRGYEKVLKIKDKKAKLEAIIAIHNTLLGPALGGIRIYPYSNHKAALTDALRLSEGMTYKSAISQVGFGGGKSVIIADPHKDKTEDLLRSFGKVVEHLNGKYICAEDSGCSTEDVMMIRKETKNVVGLPLSTSSGDPSKFTAWGVFRGITAALNQVYGNNCVKGRRVALQGIGNVGLHLLDFLFWHGAKVTIADVDEEKVYEIARRYNVDVVSTKEIHKIPCDVFAPCALGGIINDDTINELNCYIVAGCANNQLLNEVHGELLNKRNILYAPDFVINSGGLINVSLEIEKNGYCPNKSRMKIDQIYDTLTTIFKISKEKNISPVKAAMELANYRIKYGVGARATPVYFHHLNEK